MSIQDKVVIISGASGGLGQTVSRVFHEAGARLVLVGSQVGRAQSLAEELGGPALSVEANLTNPAEATQVVTTALNYFGRVDILLNLAGGFAGGSPVHDSDNSTLQHMLAINLYTACNLSRAAAEPMVRQQWGRIVNIGSRDALKGRANFSAYAMSKAALLRMTEAMAEELKAYHITVNALLPGIINTEANRQAMPHADYSTWVSPTVIADTLLFLVGPHTAITGAAIPMYEQI